MLCKGHEAGGLLTTTRVAGKASSCDAGAAWGLFCRPTVPRRLLFRAGRMPRLQEQLRPNTTWWEPEGKTSTMFDAAEN